MPPKLVLRTAKDEGTSDTAYDATAATQAETATMASGLVMIHLRPPGTPDFACLDGVWRECAQVLEVDGKPKTPVTLTRYVPCSWGQRCPPVGVIPTVPPSSAP